MTKTQLYRIVGDALIDQTDALDDEEVQAISHVIANKIAEECPDIIDEPEVTLEYADDEEE